MKEKWADRSTVAGVDPVARLCCRDSACFLPDRSGPGAILTVLSPCRTCVLSGSLLHDAQPGSEPVGPVVSEWRTIHSEPQIRASRVTQPRDVPGTIPIFSLYLAGRGNSITYSAALHDQITDNYR